MDAQSDINPVRTFFSAPNARRLYQIIQKGIREKYNRPLDDRYMEQLVEIMKMVVEPLPERIPASVDRKWFISSLNKQVLEQAVPYFAEIAQKASVTTTGKGQVPIVPPQAQSNSIDVSRPAATQLRGGDADNDAFHKLIGERTNKNSQDTPKRPKFEDDEPDYPDDINDLYELEEQSRHHHDIIEAPQQRFGDTLAAPKIYEAPAKPSYDPDSFLGGSAPRGAERLLVSTPIIQQPPQPTIGREVDQYTMPPQPAELRLIPETSRNLVGDSRMIPHLLVVNSADRNSNIYPNPSEYVIQLENRYLDVESLELCCALIPLSAYNVSTTNNVLNFEEVAGTPLVANIPAGNYPDSSALAFAVASSLNAASSLGVTYTATVDPLTGKITITSDGAGGSIFTLMFFGTPSLEGPGPSQYQREKPQYPPNSIGSTLGFGPQDYSGALTYTASGVPNLDGEPGVYIHVAEAELLESNNPRVQDAMAFIALAGGDEGRGYERFACEEWCRFIRYYSPIEGKLSKLTISLRTASGELFDFNGRNHVLTFTITTRDRTQPIYGDDSRSDNGGHSGHH